MVVGLAPVPVCREEGRVRRLIQNTAAALYFKAMKFINNDKPYSKKNLLIPEAFYNSNKKYFRLPKRCGYRGRLAWIRRHRPRMRYGLPGKLCSSRYGNSREGLPRDPGIVIKPRIALI